ncbi:hypothetical protein RM190_10870 [Paracoccus sp. CPCC 101403]|uniref:Acyloxyacyl hydrolase n=1 Tax=Paracoccus broussonetiae TaxID=3075834 RepID=A0ABU3EE07_9RHOB|nr:hypothetical protein [Paracoccus sp. CPCC 101403]MDT1062365.1 hypothetical protein [Paracoccus sp. CPCC 101403]
MTALALSIGLVASAAAAQEAPAGPDRNFFVFTGRMLDADMGESVNVIGADYEDNYITGLGVQSFFLHSRRTSVGYELGIATRYGEDRTTEAWGGLVARIDNWQLARNIFLSPSIVFGLSYVDAAHAGREQRLEAEYDGDAQLVFYLSPELDFKVSPESRYSFFWRLHHRSGAWKTLGDMKGASNANVFGLRVRF